MSDPRRVDVTECARLIRTELRAAWPGQTFKVRSSRYSLGCSVDVSWFDGPTASDVDGRVQKYAGGTFDGMTDSMTFRESILNGERVRFAAHFVQTQRRYTREFLEPVRDEVCAKFGIEPPEIRDEWGSAYINTPDVNDILTPIMREAQQRGTAAAEPACGNDEGPHAWVLPPGQAATAGNGRIRAGRSR